MIIQLINDSGVGHQTKKLKPGKKKVFQEKLRRKSKNNKKKGLEICKVCNIFINHQNCLAFRVACCMKNFRRGCYKELSWVLVVVGCDQC
jgi:hypothetical protein